MNEGHELTILPREKLVNFVILTGKEWCQSRFWSALPGREGVARIKQAVTLRSPLQSYRVGADRGYLPSRPAYFHLTRP